MLRVLRYAEAEGSLSMECLEIFYLTGCPYCAKAKAALAALCSESPAYASVPVRWIEERENPLLADARDYYYVPAIYAGEEKLYEAHPGDDYDKIKAAVKAALDAIV